MDKTEYFFANIWYSNTNTDFQGHEYIRIFGLWMTNIRILNSQITFKYKPIFYWISAININKHNLKILCLIFNYTKPYIFMMMYIFLTHKFIFVTIVKYLNIHRTNIYSLFVFVWISTYKYIRYSYLVNIGKTNRLIFVLGPKNDICHGVTEVFIIFNFVG